MSIISYSLGAVEEVTGSKHILEIDGLPYMIDCGAWQGAEDAQKRNREFTFPVDKLQAVFLTHAHYDQDRKSTRLNSSHRRRYLVCRLLLGKTGV